MKSKKIIGIVFCLLLFAVVISSGVSVSASNATTLAVNTAVKGTIAEDAGDEGNLYQVNLSSAGKFNINIKHENLFDTTVYWTVVVYAADLETELQKVSSKGVDLDLTGESLGLNKGTYFIRVVSKHTCAGTEYSDKEYTLTAKFVPSTTWEVEYNSVTKTSNNTQIGSNQIAINKKAYGTIGTSDDVDFFKVNVPKDGYIKLTFSHANALTQDICWKIYLVNAKTQEICNFNSKGTRKSCSTPNIGVTAGTYYIKVTGGDRGVFNSIDYNVKMSFKASKSWEKEYTYKAAKFNDNISTANPIKVKKTVNATLKTKDDVDYFKFKNPKKRSVSIKFSHKYYTSRAKFWNITIIDSKLRTVATFGSKGVDKATVKKLTLKKGTYYIKVTANGNRYKADKYSVLVK